MTSLAHSTRPTMLTSRSATPPRTSQTVSQGRISALAKRRCYRSIGSGAKHGLGGEASGRVPALGEHGPAGQVARGFPGGVPGLPRAPAPSADRPISATAAPAEVRAEASPASVPP